MHTTQPKNGYPQIQEITGRPAKLVNNGFGSFVFPASGVVTLKISGDLLLATSKGLFDKRESWTRLQNIDSVELVESPLWEVLMLGVPLLLLALSMIATGGLNSLGLFLLIMGIACIVLFLQYRRRYLGIYSHRNMIPVFLTKPPEMYQQFAVNVMAIARHLNTPPRPSQPNPTANGRSGNTEGRALPNTSGRSMPTSGRPTSGRPLPASVGNPHTIIQ